MARRAAQMSDVPESYAATAAKPSMRADTDEHYVSKHNKKYRPINVLSRDTWVRIVLWFVPIIFTAGMLFYFVQDLSANDIKHEKNIEKMDERQQKVSSEQQLVKFKLDVVSEKQSEIVKDIKKIDEKLDDQKDDLTAIKVKLGVRKRKAKIIMSDDED
jgi:ATP-dependent Zn protease